MTQEFCFRFIRVRPNRPEEAEVMLNQVGAKGFHVVGLREVSNDLIVVLEKELVPTVGQVLDPVAPPAKKGPGRPKKVIEEADA
jgi:hypothetical protein